MDFTIDRRLYNVYRAILTNQLQMFRPLTVETLLPHRLIFASVLLCFFLYREFNIIAQDLQRSGYTGSKDVMNIYLVSLVAIGLFLCCSGHPSRPSLPDSPEAHALFAAAERNRTQDGFLTKEEIDDIFQTFDNNSDGEVDEQEFIFIWKDRHLGDLTHAITLFHHADTDRNDFITQVPDMSRLFYYFDRDQDGKVSEDEFVKIWMSLSS